MTGSGINAMAAEIEADRTMVCQASCQRYSGKPVPGRRPSRVRGRDCQQHFAEVLAVFGDDGTI